MKMWIARDKDGELWLYDRKPIINDTGEIFVHDGEDICKAAELDSDLFPEVTFENSPQEVELVVENNTKVDMGEVSDGYHTFNELYEYRMLYNAALFNEFAKQGLYDVHKSRKHSDGKYPFGDSNWFIVMAELPTGQISNHYEMKDWDKFRIPEKEVSNKWDGHSPKDVALRLMEYLIG